MKSDYSLPRSEDPANDDDNNNKGKVVPVLN
jgi:hypothetical protein